MNLFFRLLFLLIKNLTVAKRIDYLEPATLKFSVWITDQDAFQHMNNSRYMSIVDLAVIDLIMRTGVGKHMRKKGITPVFVYKNCIYHRMLRFPQAYEVRSRFAAWDGPYVFFEHLFFRKGKLIAESTSVGRLVGKKGEKPTVQEAIGLLGWENVPESPPLNDEQKRVLDKILSARAADRAQTSS
ncbi:MAG: acyl-CoA thioesterase [Pseudomonadota bacterium]